MIKEIDAQTLELLIQKAKEASKNAYSPYSQFRVGAALLTLDGKTFLGCNVENASYGLTICAERNAIFQMIAQQSTRDLHALVVYTPTMKPSAPCGACRQVIREFSAEVRIICVCDGKEILVKSIADLLPDPFDLDKQ